jgi:hypothetical protein
LIALPLSMCRDQATKGLKSSFYPFQITCYGRFDQNMFKSGFVFAGADTGQRDNNSDQTSSEALPKAGNL